MLWCKLPVSQPEKKAVPCGPLRGQGSRWSQICRCSRKPIVMEEASLFPRQSSATGPGELGIMPPPRIPPGPRDFSLSLQSSLHCSADTWVGSGVWKVRQEEKKKSKKTAAWRLAVMPFSLEDDLGTHYPSMYADANWSRSYDHHMQMCFQLSKTVDYTC